jgi:hypothetical protein
MVKHTEKWEHAVARRVGIPLTDVTYTQTKVGQTLHMPCHVGDHLVDVKIQTNENPNGVAKRMLNQGWTLGRRLKCPDCSRSKKSSPPKKSDFHKAQLMDSAAPQSVALSRIADQLISGECVYDHEERKLVKANRSTRRAMGVHTAPEKRKPERVEKMPEATQKPITAAIPSEAAKKAKRMVYMLLEEQYDDVKKAYRSGWDDRKISLETGASIQFVKDIRESDFGPLGEPSEFGDLRAQMLAHAQDVVEKIAEIQKGLKSLESRFNAICDKNGWPRV